MRNETRRMIDFYFIRPMFVGIGLFITLCGHPQLKHNSPTSNQRLATLCKVWGLLKYFHPVIAKGKYDWDSVLVTVIPSVISAKSTADFENELNILLTLAGEIPSNDHTKQRTKNDTLLVNRKIGWVTGLNLSPSPVSAYLQKLIENPYEGRREYVSFNAESGQPIFDRENKYPGMIMPAEPYRLLTLFRYWNVIEYYYPYKYLIDKDWNTVLLQMIPRFRQATDTLQFYLAVRKMASSIQDSHSYYIMNEWYEKHIYGERQLPVIAKYIDHEVVIADFPDDSIGLQTTLKRGDIIEKINGTSVKDLMANFAPVMEASNTVTTNYYLANLILRSNDTTLTVTITRQNKTFQKKMGTYSDEQLSGSATRVRKGRVPIDLQYRLVKDHIGYVNMNWFNPRDKAAVNKMFGSFRDTKAIIFDIRNYPFWLHFEIMAWLTNSRRVFYNVYQVDSTDIGTLLLHETDTIGGTNENVYPEYDKNPYKGKVIVLVDERSRSYAEFFTMALQTIPGCTVIGSQTAGADGNVSFIWLPGNIRVTMTGVRYLYPDGTETQRRGVRVNIRTKLSIESLQKGKDDVIERAVKFASTGH